MTGGFIIGQTVERFGCSYTCQRTEPYTNRQGREIDLFVFEGGCVVCGTRFEIKVVPSTKRWNVRCPKCIGADRRPA